ncbi:VanZ family protein [Planomicrobium okeanokoites]|uniref:VanZ family protein n=1 Tax=Planomicrobium okeanokoites TaxID=244 RepID=UPI000A030949|nr:VanZ family protein [Planomicrobium okeanokoites]
MKNKKMAWALAIGWMSLIFILSHQPASVSSGLSSSITEFLLGVITEVLPGSDARVEEFHTLVRKNAHFIAYLILGVLLVNALGSWGRLTLKVFSAAFTIAVLYAASDEFHQLFIDGRSGEVWDVLIDSAGAAAGIIGCWTIGLIIREKKLGN